MDATQSARIFPRNSLLHVNKCETTSATNTTPIRTIDSRYFSVPFFPPPSCKISSFFSLGATVCAGENNSRISHKALPIKHGGKPIELRRRRINFPRDAEDTPTTTFRPRGSVQKSDARRWPRVTCTQTRETRAVTDDAPGIYRSSTATTTATATTPASRR